MAEQMPGMQALTSILQTNQQNQAKLMQQLIAAVTAAFPQASTNIVAAPTGTPVAGLPLTLDGKSYVLPLYIGT